MAEECTESSVATSSSTPQNWPWDLHHHHNHAASWTTACWHQQQNPNSNNSSCEDDVSISTSFTNASNHSGLTVDSSRPLLESASSNDFMPEHQHAASDNHLWTHLLLHGGSNGELGNNQDVGENLVDPLSSKSVSTGILEAPYDYLKKVGSNWEFSNFDHPNQTDQIRFTKLSNLVSNWSIAPPDPEEINTTTHFDPHTTSCNISLATNKFSNSSNNHYSQLKQSLISPSTGSNLLLSYAPHHLKVENNQDHNHIINNIDQAPTTAYLNRRSSSSIGGYGNIGYHIGVNSNNNSVVVEGVDNYVMSQYALPCLSTTSTIADSPLHFPSRLTKPLIDAHASRPCTKPLHLSDSKKQALPTTTPTKANGRMQGGVLTNEGKKKRSEETSDAALKKPKHENSTVNSSVKAPKVKLGDRITALQQIVSPFGKTDTASVLLEAIGYIKFLQEQVQLLSNPYMKSSSHKDPWGALDRKDKGEMKLDLRSRGLCLVPLSCTPQIYRENAGSDYWSPTYKGFLYR
ncbi:transcription factor bHLH123-like [Carica papaya]|uniref:transcription factor bHLH123-like n=1 Tax=Carica papaya TaxID=3649 RepID=UPI000B8C801D|nr:transcription factor bHLH123-like [Carica papaya]